MAATSSPNDWPRVMRAANGMKRRMTVNSPTSPRTRSTPRTVVHSTGRRVRRMVSYRRQASRPIVLGVTMPK